MRVSDDKSIIRKCSTWEDLCFTIRFEYPDLRIKKGNKNYKITIKNLKEFMIAFPALPSLSPA